MEEISKMTKNSYEECSTKSELRSTYTVVAKKSNRVELKATVLS